MLYRDGGKGTAKSPLPEAWPGAKNDPVLPHDGAALVWQAQSV